MTLQTGQTLHHDRYRIVRLLGEGGFGAVYKAWDTSLGGPVALKESLGADAAAQKQFEVEARLLFKLRHPHLPRVSDYFSIPGQGSYLVMDYIEGEDLETILQQRGGPLPEAQVVAWLGQVCDALAYLHSQTPPVIHRDIKPANIRIMTSPSDPVGQAVLVDFGIAKLFDPARKTTVGARAVTPGFSPPEQFGMGITDAQSDVYALGATAYHLLTGLTPPAAMDVVAGLSAPPRPAHEVNPAISAAVSAAVEKAMKLSRAERMRSAVEFKAGLTLSGDAPVSATIVMPPAQPIGLPQMRPVQATPPIANVTQGSKSSMGTGLRSLPAWARWTALLGVVALVVVIFLLSTTGGPGKETPIPSQTESLARAPASSTAMARVTATRTLAPTASQTLEPTSSPKPTFIPTLVLLGTQLPLPIVVISPENAGQVQQLARWGKGTVNRVVWSPDSSLLAVATSLGIYLYDANSLTQERWIEIDSLVYDVAFSPDGQSLASGSDDSMVRLWRISDGMLLRTLEGNTASVIRVAFSPDGQILASGSSDKTVRLWQVSDGKLLFSLEGHTGGVRSVAFSPDGQTLASGSSDKTVRLWRVSDGKLLNTLEGHTESVRSVAFSPDGQTLASGSSDKTVRLWRVSDGKLLNTLEGHTSSVSSITFSPDGETLASGSYDAAVRLWRVSDGSLLRTLEGHTSSVSSVAFSPDGQILASGSYDAAVRLWRVSDGASLRTLTGHTYDVISVTFSPDGQTLASASFWDNAVRLWRVSDGAPLRVLAGPSISSVAFSPDGQIVASPSWDNSVRLWRASDGALLHTLKGPADRVNGSSHSPHGQMQAFSPDGQILASASADGTVRLWRVSDGMLLHTLEEHRGVVMSVVFSPDGRYLVSASSDGTIRFWGIPAP